MRLELQGGLQRQVMRRHMELAVARSSAWSCCPRLYERASDGQSLRHGLSLHHSVVPLLQPEELGLVLERVQGGVAGAMESPSQAQPQPQLQPVLVQLELLQVLLLLMLTTGSMTLMIPLTEALQRLVTNDSSTPTTTTTTMAITTAAHLHLFHQAVEDGRAKLMIEMAMITAECTQSSATCAPLSHLLEVH